VRRILSLLFGLRTLLVIVFMVASMFGIALDRAHGAEVPEPEPTSETPSPSPEPVDTTDAPAPDPEPTPEPVADPVPAPCSADDSSTASVPELGCAVYVRLPADDLSYLRKAGSAALAALGVLTLCALTTTIGSFRR
jgi:hypothetical protein